MVPVSDRLSGKADKQAVPYINIENTAITATITITQSHHVQHPGATRWICTHPRRAEKKLGVIAERAAPCVLLDGKRPAAQMSLF